MKRSLVESKLELYGDMNVGYMDVFSQAPTMDGQGVIISCLTTGESIYEKSTVLDNKFPSLRISNNFMYRIVPF